MPAPLTTTGAVIGRNVRRLREAADLSQGQVAARMVTLGHTGWITSTCSRIERGIRQVQVDELADLTAALGHPMVEILRHDHLNVDRATRGRLDVLAGHRAPTGQVHLEEADRAAQEPVARRVLSRLVASVDWATAGSGRWRDASTEARTVVVLETLGRLHPEHRGDLLGLRDALAAERNAEEPSRGYAWTTRRLATEIQSDLTDAQ